MASASHRRRLGDVAVLGFGVTGESLARYLVGERDRGRVGRIALFGRAAPERVAGLRAELGGGVDFHPGEEVEGTFDLAIASPGISVFSDFFASAGAHAGEVVGEPEFVWRESPERWVAVTGTNGKTTTTTLTAALLERGGLPARLLGNVGDALAGALADREGEWFVAELSSFQLATTSRLHPRAAILLNITPDHLAWHRTLDHYAASKERVFANLTAEDLAVLVTDDPACAELAPRLAGRGLRVLAVSATARPATADAAWVEDGMLRVSLDGETLDLGGASSLKLHGAHNLTNALAAASVALFLGVAPADVRAGLEAFPPLDHRVEEVAEVDGVTYVDDSKATNTDAVEKALRAFEPGHVVVLLGGTDKGTDLASLARAVAATCRAAVCYGEAGPRIADALAAAGAREVVAADHLADAFERARGLAGPGDVVLLSPACSSFDEFGGFEERGDVFKELVGSLGGGA